MKKNRLIALLLCLCMTLALLPTAALAAPHGISMQAVLEEPEIGKAPSYTATDKNNAHALTNPKIPLSVEVTRVEWSGSFDANGCFQPWEAYTVTITERICADMVGNRVFDDSTPLICGHKSTLVSRSEDQLECTVSYTWPALKGDTPMTPASDKDVTSLALTVEEPKDGGTSSKEATALGNGSADTVTVTKVEWAGGFVNGKFQVGASYSVTVSIQAAQGYTLNENMLATVNGAPAEITSFKSGTMKVKARFTCQLGAGEASVKDKAHRVSLAEADANNPLANPLTVVISEDTLDMNYVNSIGSFKDGSRLTSCLSKSFTTLDGDSVLRSDMVDRQVTRIVYDVYREDDYSVTRFPNVNELWLSPKCDIDGILNGIGRAIPQTAQGDRDDYNTWNCTVFIPDALYPNGPTYHGTLIFDPFGGDHAVNTPPGCRVMLYSGDDVYAAAEKGKEAARDFCTNHDYTAKIMSADRFYSRATCQSDERWYYSCSKCGKCEYDPNHTFFLENSVGDNMEDGGKFTAHDYSAKTVSDEHFLGLNANGDRVYLKSCTVCGIDNRQEDIGTTYDTYKNVMGMDGGQSDWKNYVEQMKQVWAEGGTYYNTAITDTPEKGGLHDSFAVDKDAFVWATVSGWAGDAVQAAAGEGLVDKELLGVDYTQAINRLQFVSVAVRMAEKMTGKTIAAAPAGTFADTDSAYALKAYAAGITTGTTATTFEPYALLSRQQMATFLFRALQYVKDNSETEYTVYDSKLGNYADAGQIQSWATESMVFMNALGLINGTTATTLDPVGNCTIEQAVVVAHRSLDAGVIGWYLCLSLDGASYGSPSNYAKCVYGDRIWVSDAQGTCVDPYGYPGQLALKYFYAIKDRK